MIFKIKNYLRNKAQERVFEFVVNNYSQIVVHSGKGLFNGKCQFNAVDSALRHRDKYVCLVMFCTKGFKDIGIHFINFDEKNNKYIDNSMGQWVSCYDYYFVKNILTKDMFSVNVDFEMYEKYIKKQLPIYLRPFN